jgi:hypothetical protein
MMRLPTLIAMLCPFWGRENLSGHRNVADEQEPLPFALQQDFVNYRKTQFTIDRIGAAAQRFATILHGPVTTV